MKICYVLSHFYPYIGGAEQAFMDLILNLVSKGVHIRVVTSSVNGKNEIKRYKGIDIYYYDWKQFMGHPLIRKSDLYDHIKWADVVNSAVYSPVPIVNKLCHKLHKPHVCDVYEVLGNRWFWVEKNFIKAFILKSYEKYIVKKPCDFYVTSSMATQSDLKKVNKKSDSKCIYWISDNNKKNVNCDRYQFNKYFGTKDDDIIFLNYGRPGKTKGIFIYLDAIIKVVNTIPSDKIDKIKFCFIMGAQPSSERQRFLKKVEDNNLLDLVIVRESVERDDLENYRMCADYIVVPSITEGFGLSAIEACETGKKLICSNAGSLPEVTFGEVAEFENKNSDDLAKILVDIIHGKDVFSYKRKKDFSGDTISSQYLDLYLDLIEKNNK